MQVFVALTVFYFPFCQIIVDSPIFFWLLLLRDEETIIFIQINPQINKYQALGI